MAIATNRRPKAAPQPRAEAKLRKPAAAAARKTTTALPDRRGDILAVATRRFAKYGFEFTTVRQIADDVNILSGSLYYHFATKDDILQEIVTDAAQLLRDNTIRVANLPIDAERRLVALLLLDLGELTRNQEVHAILANERRMFRERPEFAHIVEAKKAAYMAWLAVLQDGIKTELFKPDIDIHMTVSTIVRMLNTAADWYKNEDKHISGNLGGYALDDMIDFHLDFIVSAIRIQARAGLPIPRDECEVFATFQC